LDRAALNEEKRSVAVSFSSETPVMRWFGNEYLWHDKEAVDLKRLSSMGSALLNHNPDFIVGPLSDVRLERKKTYATINFDDDEDGNKAMSKVKSGSLRGVSVGYSVQTFKELQEGESWRGFQGPAHIATRWTPHEISLTPIPADPNVGVGRELTRSLEGIQIERSEQKTQQEVVSMDKEEIMKLIKDTIREASGDIIKESVTAMQKIIQEANKVRFQIEPETLTDFMGRAAAISPEAQVKVAQMAAEGKTENDMNRTLLNMATGKTDASTTQPASHGDGTQQDPNNNGIDVRSAFNVPFDKLEDDDLVRAITNAHYPLQ